MVSWRDRGSGGDAAAGLASRPSLASPGHDRLQPRPGRLHPRLELGAESDAHGSPGETLLVHILPFLLDREHPEYSTAPRQEASRDAQRPGVPAAGKTRRFRHMSTTGLVVLVLVLGFVWGGFAVLLTWAARKERRKREEERSAAS